MKSVCLLLFAILITLSATIQPTQAQFLSANVRIDGLTCSLCNLSVHKALKKLDFIEEAAPNLDEVTMDITFKKGAAVSFDRLAAAVKGAGFSIGSLKTRFYFQNVNVGEDFHFNYKGTLYHFVNTKERMLNGATDMTVIDKQFVPTEEYEQWAKNVKHECYKTGIAGDCCKEDTPKQQKPQRVYHVTL